MAIVDAEKINIGTGTVIEPTAIIKGISGSAKHINIGDYCYIGHNVQIICDNFEMGDYCKIHHDSNIHGYKPCRIGHNLWMGQFSIIDSIGGVVIGNNCGIGAHSQLWSHIKFGDTNEGCRFLSEGELNIGNDVWFVGHCIVSPIKAADKSMALVGSVITKDMEYNTIYSGVPARKISDKIGPQFIEVDAEQKLKNVEKHLIESGLSEKRIRIVMDHTDISDDEYTYFIISTRQYTKKGYPEEHEFMKYLLPEKAKFTPV